MNRLRDHLRSLGPTWTHLTAIPVMVYTVYLFFGRGEHRWEMVALFFVVPILAFSTKKTRRLYEGVYPMWLTAVLYDSMRFVRNVGVSAERVHICDLRQHELDLFGITSGGARMTLQDYFWMHPSRFLDVYCAVPYCVFLYVSVLFATYLYFKDFVALKRYTWTFFVMNVAAFVTYHLYPAAPPWYYHAHGCVADLGVHAYEGTHLAAVDAMLGFPYFSSFYGRSADVFGAVPSLHVAYPLLILLEGWKHFRALGRGLAILFAASMIFAAVYLDHHWVIDVLLGLTYAATVHGIFRFLFARRAAASASDLGTLELTRPTSGT
jgi:inositol phosphorylceramide synthase catalytic subunit